MKHARRIYVGGIPPTSTEHEIGTFFNDLCRRGLPQIVLPNDGGPPVMNVYLNLDKCFAFVEMPSVEIASAAMKLDGITYKHFTGPCTLRIRRPHDYRPELVPETGPITEFNLPEFQMVGTTVGDGPGKVFVGGLPYHLNEEQVKELLSAFGPLKSFNLVRDPGAAVTKGYGFCEYFDERTTQIAIQGLNDMPIGDKRLTVRVADSRTTAGLAPGQANPFATTGVSLPITGSNAPPAAFLNQPPTKVRSRCMSAYVMRLMRYPCRY
jgi:splicing factor U2AF 65 kDa subunit